MAEAGHGPAVDRRMGGWVGVEWASIEVGQTWPASTVRIGTEQLARYLRCIGRTDAPTARTPVPAFMLNELRVLKSHLKLPPGVLHAQESIELASPAYPDEDLHIEVRIADRYLKNDKRFVVVAQSVRRASDGTPIMALRHTLYWPC
jgi:hypothetical protein